MDPLKQKQIDNFTKRLHQTQNAMLAPPPDLDLGQWSTEYLYLSPEASSLPGKFRFDRAPFQREVFESLSNPNIRRVVIMSASQIMKTQAILAYIGFIVHLDPGPTLVVQPSLKQANSFSKDRLDTMFRDVPELRERIPTKNRRDGGNTVFHKRFPGGYVAIATSNSPSDLAARPIRFLFCDETDRYETTIEGDPIDIAEKRTTTFWNSKIVLVSSPGDDEISRIKREYEASDKRIYLVPCHHCDLPQQLIWKQVKFDKTNTKTAHYECEGCKQTWSDHERNRNISKGKWEATADSEVVGYHISALYSSFKTLKDLADEFLAAKKDPEQLKVFVNTRLAETWESDSSRVKDINFLERLEEYKPEKLPEDVLIITAGVDVQIDRLEMEVVGWGLDEESWSIEYVKIMGDPTSPAPWAQLESFLLKKYKRTDGLILRINAMCIDTGGELAPDNIFAFARKNKRYNIFPIKGAPGGRPIFPSKSGRHKKGGRFYLIGVDSAKSHLYSQLSMKEHGPNFCHFPYSYSQIEDYFEGLTSEKSIIKTVKGARKKVWIRDSSARNEPLDCRVYALAARKSIQYVNVYALKNSLLKKARAPQDEPVEEVKKEKEQPTVMEQIQKKRRNARHGRHKRGYISDLS